MAHGDDSKQSNNTSLIEKSDETSRYIIGSWEVEVQKLSSLVLWIRSSKVKPPKRSPESEEETHESDVNSEQEKKKKKKEKKEKKQKKSKKNKKHKKHKKRKEESDEEEVFSTIWIFWYTIS